MTLSSEFADWELPSLDLATAGPAELHEVLSRHGALDLIGHGIPPAVFAEAEYQAMAFFALPEGEKMRCYIGRSPNHRGYVPFSEQGDYADEGLRCYEAFDLALELPWEDPDVRAGVPLLGPNIWPDRPAFRAALEALYEAYAQVAARLTGLLEQSLGLVEGAMARFMVKPLSQLRLIRYHEGLGAELGMGAHTDYECFTLVHQTGPGLELLDGEGHWRRTLPQPGGLLLMVGDVLQLWSGGRYRAALHRVSHDDTDRLSIPYFAATDFHAEIRPLVPLLPGRPLPHGGEFTAGPHLLRYLMRDFPYLRKRLGGPDADA